MNETEAVKTAWTCPTPGCGKLYRKHIRIRTEDQVIMSYQHEDGTSCDGAFPLEAFSALTSKGMKVATKLVTN